MSDFTKAGLDRGDIEAEIKNLLISAKSVLGAYVAVLDELTQEEIRSDYEMYVAEYKENVEPKVRQALKFGGNASNMAKELESLYIEFFRTLEERLRL